MSASVGEWTGPLAALGRVREAVSKRLPRLALLELIDAEMSAYAHAMADAHPSTPHE